MSSAKQCCCPTDVKPAVNNYQGVGRRVTLDALGYDMYVTGDGNNSKAALILAYDIFGWTPNAEQLADNLADQGKFLVVMPDLMRGEAWDIDNMPPAKSGKFPPGVEPGDGMQSFYTWITSHPNCKLDRTEEITAINDYLVKTHNIGSLGMVGLCWGAKVCFAVSNQDALVQAIASCHGSQLDTSDAEAVTVPTCMLNSKDEPETYRTEIKPILDAKPFAVKNVFKDFPTMPHGWMGTRTKTDFSVQEYCDKYAEGVSDVVNFFTNTLR